MTETFESQMSFALRAVKMSLKIEDVETVVCRLCMSTEPGQIQITDDEGEKNKLYRKIKRCLSIQIQNGDTLTKFVCRTCIIKVEEIFMYQQSCMRIQSMLETRGQNSEVVSEVSEVAMAEVESIVQRLQAGRSALSITPVSLGGETKPHDNFGDELEFDSQSALSITPILRNSESSGDDDSLWDGAPPFVPLPHLKSPSFEDYVLIQEETFGIDPVALTSKTGLMEHHMTHGDADVVETQMKRRVVLPPMWDVYEKSTDKENITHKRYVVSKKSFPCSLCGSCVAFQCQQVSHLDKEKIQAENTLLPTHDVKEDQCNENITTSEGHNQREQQTLQDLRSSEFHSQDSGLLDCPECGKLFPRRSSWKRHLRSHFEGRAFHCSLCGRGFNRKEHLSRHMVSHSGGRPFRCESCFKPFTRKEHLARHLACNPACRDASLSSLPSSGQDLSVPRPFSCGVCLQSFQAREHLIRHHKSAHSFLNECTKRPNLPDEESTQRYRCNVCSKSFSEEIELQKHNQTNHLNGTGDNILENKEAPLCNSNEGGDLGSPEQIEVEVNLLENGSDADSITEGEDLFQKHEDCGGGVTSISFQSFEADSNHEEVKLNKEDLLLLQVNEAMRKAREGSQLSCDAAPRCEVCKRSFTCTSHLVRHISQFHPQGELEYAVAHSLGTVLAKSNGVPSEKIHQQSSSASILLSRDDEEADDESGGTLSSSLSETLSSLSYKGGKHLCSICGKMFGRRYHLVRHRRTQHGVESVRTRPVVDRAPKQPISSAAPHPFYCPACEGQFSSHNTLRFHLCKSNNNTIGLGSGSLAEMAAKISDKLHRRMDGLEYLCQSCDRRFCNRLELDKHLETHVDDLMRDMLWK